MLPCDKKGCSRERRMQSGDDQRTSQTEAPAKLSYHLNGWVRITILGLHDPVLPHSHAGVPLH